MHQPPAVSYRVVRSRWHCFVIVLLTVLAASGSLAFTVNQSGFWRSIALWFGVAASSAWAFLAWYRTSEGHIRWDGHGWHGAKRALVHVRVIIDFQSLMLIRTIDQRGKSRWIWLERTSDCAHWLRLRRALVASSI